MPSKAAWDVIVNYKHGLEENAAETLTQSWIVSSVLSPKRLRLDCALGDGKGYRHGVLSSIVKLTRGIYSQYVTNTSSNTTRGLQTRSSIW